MTTPKRVVVTGATGLIGRDLCRQLLERGYEVTVFSRDSTAAKRHVPGAHAYVDWTPAESGSWAGAIDGAYAVVNLAGASVFGHRWTEGYKREIRDSRVVGTRGLVRAMFRAADGHALGQSSKTRERTEKLKRVQPARADSARQA